MTAKRISERKAKRKRHIALAWHTHSRVLATYQHKNRGSWPGNVGNVTASEHIVDARQTMLFCMLIVQLLFDK